MNSLYESIKKKEKESDDLIGVMIRFSELTNIKKDLAKVIQIINTDMKAQIPKEEKKLLQDITQESATARQIQLPQNKDSLRGIQ